MSILQHNIINHNEKKAPLTPEEALRLATINAAKALQMGTKIGNLEIGKEADFIIIDGKEIINNKYNNFGNEDYLSKLIYTNSNIAVKETYIRGKQVYKKK